MKPSENPQPNGSAGTPGQGTGPTERTHHDDEAAVGRVPSPGGPELQWEQRLRRTAFRQPSPAWRDEILSAAGPGGRPQLRQVPPVETASWAQQLVAWLRGIPTEWTAAAALWVLIVVGNYASSPGGSSDSAASSNFANSSPEQREESIQQALAFRRQLLSELQGTDALDDLPRTARPEADRLKRQLNFLGTNGLAAASA